MSTATAVTVVPPAFEVETVANTRLLLRVDHDTEDFLIARWLSAWRRQAEFNTQRALLLQTLELALDEFPVDGIRLDRTMKNQGAAPTIVSVTYVDEEGVTQTMASGDYYIDARQSPCWLLPAVDGSWPATRQQANAVIVRYTAGFSEGNVPEPIWAYVMANVANSFANREDAKEVGEDVLASFKTWGV